ncbi:hypothetical protein HPB52_015360 [Rhipicephalus sanguineus]|uniref:G-protein coupled receptors family 1 profile domain-containing protein n=1 Tax=Rhipicephalus sanguineus TaxID=34632 RepID=A0A9D4PP17_RHISA|nr:hypothetical protein HPB52_015360 [Rhipicephalus sanguineus]
MFVTITHSKVGLRSTQQLQDRAIAKRFAFIVGTDFLCWMPIVFIKIIAIAGTKIDETLYAWVAVFLLPVNSALNPVLYTLTTRMFKQQLNRFLDNLRQCERTPSHRQSGQSWSSVPTVRGQKKTLVTSLSDAPQPTQEEMKTFPTSNGHAGANDTTRSTNSSGKSVLSTTSASSKSKWRRHPRPRFRVEDSI